VRKLSAALLFILIAAAARAEWKEISTQTKASPARGLEHRYVVLEDSATGERASMELALFSIKSCRLRVIDQPNEPRVDLAEAMLREKCLAGVNGGYFEPDYAPVGLLISDGRMIAPLRKARLLSGVLSVANGQVRLQRTSEFAMTLKITAAVQCGPFLVDHARAVLRLDNSRPARRTFVAIGNARQIALGFCSEVSLAQLSRILLVPEIIAKFKIERALNLDGGSSSAFWFANEGKAFSIPEQKTVRDFVAIVPK